MRGPHPAVALDVGRARERRVKPRLIADFVASGMAAGFDPSCAKAAAQQQFLISG
jgi:hypothetical protein